MNFSEKLTLTESELIQLKKELTGPFNTPDAMPMGENDSKAFEVAFSDGMKMILRIVGVAFEEGSSNTPYTEASLIDYDGAEVALGDPDDFAFVDGEEWTLEVGGDTYTVTITQTDDSDALPESGRL